MAWLGEIPEHWEVLPTRALFDEIKDRDQPDKQMLSVTIKRGVIPQSEFLENTTKKDSSNLDKSNYKLVQPGDIAYNKMRAWQGAIGVSSYLGIISPAYVVQRPRNCSDSRYFHQLFRIPAFAEECERWSYGIASDMWSLRPEHFRLIYSCVPPLAEQAAIVRYLDYVERRIQRYVGTKRKLLELLAEQKQAIIHRAVTRGLDPDVPLKPSGVEWLGDVPAHWDVRRLKYLLHERDVRSADGSEQLLRVSQYTGVSERKSENGTDAPDTRASSLVGYRCVSPNDLVVNIMLAWNGSMGVSDFSGIASPAYCVYKFNDNAIPRYFHNLLRSPSYKARIKAVSTGVVESRLRLYTDDLYRLEGLLPPLPEQTAIVEYLDKTTAKIDAAIARARREVTLLSEYRARLIADVVTGKVDVREAATKLSDEADAPDVMPDSDTDDVLDSDTTFDEAVELDMVAELGHEN